MDNNTVEQVCPALLSIRGAAAYLGVGADVIRKLIAKGELGFVRIGEDRRIPRAELDRWWQAKMNSNARTPQTRTWSRCLAH